MEGILPKGPYLPWVSMAGRALLAGYHGNELQSLKGIDTYSADKVIDYGIQAYTDQGLEI